MKQDSLFIEISDRCIKLYDLLERSYKVLRYVTSDNGYDRGILIDDNTLIEDIKNELEEANRRGE